MRRQTQGETHERSALSGGGDRGGARGGARPSADHRDRGGHGDRPAGGKRAGAGRSLYRQRHHRPAARGDDGGVERVATAAGRAGHRDHGGRADHGDRY
ncbi:hypothetical protein CA237_19135 [Sphingomonas sp. ABOLH]|nr:hypothetical protein CA237_19135 [Sphingomonas sp. ABOLH]